MAKSKKVESETPEASSEVDREEVEEVQRTNDVAMDVSYKVFTVLGAQANNHS